MKPGKDDTLKRAFDIAAAAGSLAVAAPVIAVTAAAMAVSTRSSPLFLQKRAGLNDKPFTIVKIKTMKDADLPTAQRITRLSRLVRKTRLDELPQLVNVLKGEMSLVGPRPLMVEDPVAHDPVRTQVKPGMTGLTQIFNLNRPTGRQTLARDHEYVRRIKGHGAASNFIYDLGIIARTPKAIITGRKNGL